MRLKRLHSATVACALAEREPALLSKNVLERRKFNGLLGASLGNPPAPLGVRAALRPLLVALVKTGKMSGGLRRLRLPMHLRLGESLVNMRSGGLMKLHALPLLSAAKGRASKLLGDQTRLQRPPLLRAASGCVSKPGDLTLLLRPLLLQVAVKAFRTRKVLLKRGSRRLLGRSCGLATSAKKCFEVA